MENNLLQGKAQLTTYAMIIIIIIIIIIKINDQLFTKATDAESKPK